MSAAIGICTSTLDRNIEIIIVGIMKKPMIAVAPPIECELISAPG